MSGGTRRDAGLAVLVAQRLALVAEVSALTAEAQRLNQKLSGIQIEVLRLELEIGKHGGGAELVRDLPDAEASAEAMRQACIESEERILAIEGKVADVDRALAEATSAIRGDKP
ncbi:hypothetical protein FJ417_17325 [Mesorhizobium sp. B3-1-7]|uniref:hypothetical protein n=1 Tax=Mesorhizobium sp. B3-1-7 TaxID=2589894 RepID=UPI00112A71BF|nr:hypothetical protein [Mesorhizobium sp. B3-1-7]TPI59082.1 hypothetical protein FJ417_17325 [Mesorhizobium sp. B3-1-7]